MTKNNFVKAVPLSVWVKIVGMLLAVLYASLTSMIYWRIGPFNFHFQLFLASLIAAIGVLCRKEWARKALVVLSGIGLVHVLINAIWVSKGMDNLAVSFSILFASIVFFYRQPFVKVEFRKAQPFHPRWDILLIDDDKVLLKMMSSNFKRKGVTLLTAGTGEKGLIIAQNKKLDLIILDVILPKMKGREVCQRLKEDSRTKDIPIIFLTIKDSLDDIRAELEAGAVSHLTKPVDFPNLYREIRRILGE